MITENISSTVFLIFHILASIIVIGITSKIFLTIARLHIESTHKLINTISSKLPTFFTTLITTLYLASIIGTGLVTLKQEQTKQEHRY